MRSRRETDSGHLIQRCGFPGRRGDTGPEGTRNKDTGFARPGAEAPGQGQGCEGLSAPVGAGSPLSKNGPDAQKRA